MLVIRQYAPNEPDPSIDSANRSSRRGITTRWSGRQNGTEISIGIERVDAGK